MRSIFHSCLVMLLATGATAAVAGDVEILDAKARLATSGTYSFDVTLKHSDTGWDHYANAWDIVSSDGKVLGTRKLLHPHVKEQPFTRSLRGVKLPKGTKTVTVRAYDSVHGVSAATRTIELPQPKQSKAPKKRKKAKRGSH